MEYAVELPAEGQELPSASLGVPHPLCAKDLKARTEGGVGERTPGPRTIQKAGG